jgi:hypothetical protein
MKDAVYLAVSLNYAVTPAVLPVEEIYRLEQVIGTLPEEAAEKVWQETQDPEMLLQVHRQLCRKKSLCTVKAKVYLIICLHTRKIGL